MITFEAVRKQFGDGTVAVEHLDLELPTGQITVFVGPSGCGKTTSLRMINRMIDPSAGKVAIDGKDVRSQDPATLRRGIGYVIQSGGLFPHKTVLDNVLTVPKLLGRGREKNRALELLERVGLPTSFATRYPAQLSGGQRQRVGVARALAADPPVMLMDEPFSAVDPVVRGQLQEEFLRLQGELGKTIAVVTHDIDEAITLGDRIAVFREGGHLAQVGSPRELLTEPADDFVRNFVGRDRGYRGLSFVDSSGLALRPLDGTPLDEAGRPVGVETFRADDSLRLVIDLTLTSPTGTAVQVDDTGRATGVVRHGDVAELLEKRALEKQR